MTRLPALIGDVVADILDVLGFPLANTGGNVAGVTLSSLFERRRKQAEMILLDELRKGRKTLRDVGDLEAVVAMLYRYGRAAQEGAATLNLRLMAKVMAGQAHIGNLVPDEFLYYADLLASLRREEVIYLATLHKSKTDPDVLRADEGSREHQGMESVRRQLIPRLFKDVETCDAVAYGCIRTGLVSVSTGFGGGVLLVTSPLMDQLEKIASLEEAVREDDAGDVANTVPAS